MKIGPETLEAADANFVRAWRAFLALAPQPGAIESDDVLVLSSGEHVPLFNPAFMLRCPHDPDGAVDRIVRHYASLDVPFVLHFRDELCPGVAAACSARGLFERWRPPLMVLEPIPAQRSEPPPSEMAVAELDAANLDDYLAVLAQGFGMPEDLVQRLFGGPVSDIPEFTGFVGFVGGVPVAVSGLFMTQSIAGIYNIATVPEGRGRGYGAALTWEAVMAGRELGATQAILQSSEAGEPVYRRMGFLTPAHYRQFEGPPQ